jgi:hypothetical protein
LAKVPAESICSVRGPRFTLVSRFLARARAVGKLERFKRIALRCEKTAQNYGALVAFTCGLILIKSVQTA